jgi:cation:H+ antiporter
VCGAEAFAEHLGVVAVRLDVSAFALALLLAGAGREELATRRRRFATRIARHRGDVIGANAVICLVALGVGPAIAPLPFRADVMRYAALWLPLGAVGAWFAWNGSVTRFGGVILVALYIAISASSGCSNAGHRPWVSYTRSRRQQHREGRNLWPRRARAAHGPMSR